MKTTGGDPIVQVSIFSSPVFDLPERGGASSEGKVGLFLYQQLVIKFNFTIPWLSCGNIHYINWSLKIQTSCLHWIPPLRKHWKLKSCRRDWPKAIFNCSIWVGTFFEIFWFFCVAPLFYTLPKTVLSAFILQKINCSLCIGSWEKITTEQKWYTFLDRLMLARQPNKGKQKKDIKMLKVITTIFIFLAGLPLVVEIILHVWFMLHLCVLLCSILFCYKSEFH